VDRSGVGSRDRAATWVSVPGSRFYVQPHPQTLADFWGLTPLHRRLRVGKMLTGDEAWSIKSLDDNEEEEVAP
jgi:hypothetical protein